jgi:linoleoyl-CoA desaturase
MSQFNRVHFDTQKTEFVKVLRKRVNLYFKERNLSKNSNFNMVFKTIFMISIYFIPFSFIISGVVETWWVNLILWSIMGFGMAGIGMSIMHDANHGSYSKSKKINSILGYLIHLIGGSATNWKLQHNVLHHTYTNISGMDEDLDSDPLMRFSPDQKRKKFHRFQHIYAWFLYGLMTISWALDKDFLQLFRYKRKGLLNLQKINFSKALTFLIFSKIFYYGYVLVIPLIFASSWWTALVGFFIMHFIAGFVLAIVFQCAHVVENADYPKPQESGNMEHNWFAHQLHTTSNFAHKARLFSWYVGGLNFQVEHHLFPNICHVHYRKLSPIVKKTAEEFGLPYHTFTTFFDALSCHTRQLKKLGVSN